MEERILNYVQNVARERWRRSPREPLGLRVFLNTTQKMGQHTSLAREVEQAVAPHERPWALDILYARSSSTIIEALFGPSMCSESSERAMQVSRIRAAACFVSSEPCAGAAPTAASRGDISWPCITQRRLQWSVHKYIPEAKYLSELRRPWTQGQPVERYGGYMGGLMGSCPQTSSIARS